MQSISKFLSAGVFALGLVAGGQVIPTVTHAAVLLPAPAAVAATRDASTPTNFTVNWKTVVGDVDHYNVSVFYNATDHITTVPATETSLAVVGLDAVTSYRITVSSRDSAGAGTTSTAITLNPLVPGVVKTPTAVRDSAATSLKIAWAAPAWQGYSAVTTYDLTLTRLVDNVVVFKESTVAFSSVAVDLDPTKQYAAKIVANNSFGSGTAASVLVGNDRPGTPTAPVGVRDAVSPSVVHFTWVDPAHVGSSAISYYEVVYGIGSLKETLTVKTRGADIALDSTRSGVVAVRACNDAGCGFISPVVTMAAVGATVSPTIATANPFVLVTNDVGTVTIETRGYIGASSVYPRLVFRVFPTMGNMGYTDTQIGQNGARTLIYKTVPTGTYTVTVSGLPDGAPEVEIARKVVIVNQDGLLTAAQWQLVKGAATFTASTVDMPTAGENRVLSTKPLTSSDMVFSTDATLKSGAGYGIWFRAQLDSLNRMNGYTFQYDPLYGNAFIIRHWYQGTECSTPIAKSGFPSGFAVNAKHRVVVVVKGDTIWASVDGVEMFRVNSLAAAAASSPCKYPLPTGTRIGFRTWNTSPAVFENTTLS